MISVIIPALNEERTIGKVVQFVKKMQSVDEIIVVDAQDEAMAGIKFYVQGSCQGNSKTGNSKFYD